MSERGNSGDDRAGGPPIEDLFDYDDDAVDFMSAESFPASDPPPPQPSFPHDAGTE